MKEKYKFIYFPCNKDKSPAISQSFTSLIESIPRRNKNEKILGVRTGKIAGFIVLDADFYKEGAKNVYKYLSKKFWIKLRKITYCVKTQSGGYHYYFNYDSEFTNNSINKNFCIDIKSNNGYVISDKSPNYIGNKCKIIDIPNELKEFLKENVISSGDIIEDLPKNDIIFERDIIKNLVNRLEKSKNNNEPYDDIRWHIITNILYTFDMKDFWDEWSRQSKTKYNKINNNKIWNKQKKYVYSPLKLLMMNKIKLDKWYYKKIDDKIIINSKKVIINDKYLDIKLKNSKNYLIKSDPGTGKTTLFKNYIKKKMFISIVSRRKLADDHMKKLANCKTKLYYENNLLEYGDNIIISIDSLLKIKDLDFSDYIIFIDEFNSVLEHLILSKTFVQKNRKEIFNLFVKIISNCKQIICVDADINDISYIFYKLILKDRFEFVENKYQNFKNVKVFIHTDENKLVNLIKEEKKFMICSDSATKIKNLNHKIKFTRIIKENCIDEEQDDNDDNEDLDSINKLAFSPKIIYGLDSQMKRNVYGFFKGHTISPPQMVQQIARCRNPNEIHILYENKEKCYKPDYDNLKDINESVKIKLKYIDDVYSLKCEDENFYTKLKCLLDYRNDCYKTNKYTHLINILKSRGYDVKTYFEKNNNLNWKDIKKLEKEMTKIKFKKLLDNNNLPKLIIKRNKKLKIPEKSLADLWEFLTFDEKYKQVLIYKIMRDGFPKKILENINRDNDFIINKGDKLIEKISYIKEVFELFEINILNMKNINFGKIRGNNYSSLEKKYRLISQTKKSKLNFENPREIYKTMGSVLKGIFGNLIKSNRQRLVDNTRIYLLKINDIELKKLYNFSNIKFECEFIE